MPLAPPEPSQVVGWLLTHEAGNIRSVDALADAAERIFGRLHSRLTVLIGPTGFDSLWVRAMFLARQQLQTAGIVGELALYPPPAGLRAAVRERPATEAQHVLTTAFASFIALLFTFIGADLGVRLLQQAWPELPLDVFRLSAGDQPA